MPKATGKTSARAASLDQVADIYRLIVEAAPNAMVMTDHEGKIVLVNTQTEKLFGYKREELLGQAVEILLPAQYRARHPGYRANFSAAPQTRAMGAGRDLFGLRKDGREVPVEIGLNPLKTSQGVFILAAIVDITERRELQQKLAQSEALAAVGTMAAVMAHEIRNPLGSVVMAAKSLIRGNLIAADRQTVISVLSEESQRLNRTLQDFLQYARPREPKLELADLNQTVTEIIHALRSDKDLARQVQFDVALDARLAPFPHDSDQLRQVLWNLILNAIQAMESKGRMRIATTAAAGQASFCVVDSGPGIDPESIGKLFDPFFTTKKKGTGLGLAIAQRIVQAHGGRIVAESEPDAGARFSVVLPIHPDGKRPAA